MQIVSYFLVCRALVVVLLLPSVVFEPSTNTVFIERFAFYNCTELLSVIQPKNLERIPPYCFGRCTTVIIIPIPSSGV